MSFNQLHKEDFGRNGYDKKCKKCDESVKGGDIVKGYEYEPDKYVLIEKEDFEKLRLKSTRIIEIEGFVDSSEVDPTLYDSPYYAGPDGPVAAKAYGLLRETLKETGKMGIGRVVLRDRESIMLLTARDEGLLLYKLRFPNEVRKIDDIPQLDEVSADKDQLKLARTLVESMSTTFGDLELEDRYRSALIEMVQAKVAGEEIVTVEEEEAPVVDIMTALKQSIDQAKGAKKPMKKAAASKEAAKESAPKKTAAKTTAKAKSAKAGKAAKKATSRKTGS